MPTLPFHLLKQCPPSNNSFLYPLAAVVASGYQIEPTGVKYLYKLRSMQTNVTS